MDAYAGGEEEGEEGGEKLRIIDGFRLYPRRWLMLALFSLLSLSNALAWISFAPISYHTAEFYRIREHWVSGLAMVYMLAYIGGVWVGAWAIEKNGLRFGVVAGSILNMGGALIRVGGADPHAFWLTFLGQVVLGCAQVFILEVPPTLSANWFGQSQRSLATAIGLLSNQLGVGLGFILAPFIVHHKQDLPRLLYLEAVICGVVSVLVIVFFRGEAPSPPSAAAELKARVNQMKGKGLRPLAFVLGVFSRKPPAPVDESEALQVPLVAPPGTTSAAGAEYDSEAKTQGRTAEAVVPPSESWRMDSYQHGGLIPGVGDGDDADLEEDDEENELLNNITVAWWTRSYWRNMRELLRDRNFLLLMFAFGIAVGAFYSTIVLFGHMIPQSGRQVGVLGMLFISMGIAGSFVAGVVLDTTRQYALFTKIGFGGLLIGYVWFFLEGAAGRNFIMMSFPCSCLGFFMAAIFTLCLETGVECTYPVPEGTTAGLQLLCAQVFGVIFITVMEATRRFSFDARRATFAVSNTILLGALVFSFVLIMFFKGESKRPHHHDRRDGGDGARQQRRRRQEQQPSAHLRPQTY